MAPSLGIKNVCVIDDDFIENVGESRSVLFSLTKSVNNFLVL